MKKTVKTEIHVYVPEREVWVTGGKEVNLAPKEFDVFVAIAQDDGQVVSRDTIIGRVQKKNELPIDPLVVNQHVSRLRRKLGKVGNRCLLSVFNHGYKTRGVVVVGRAEVEA